jgi:small GTP-binding protein
VGIETERTSVREAFEGRVDRIESFVADHGSLFAGIAKRQQDLDGRIANFRHHHGRLDKSLAILLLGGTGAGKSTLINALAGAEISSTSAMRAHTENYFIYHHRETAIAFLDPAMAPGDRWFPHEREALRDKVIIDAPDFDSLKSYNRDKVLAMLELADMVLCVVTSEKYRDRALYEILATVSESKRFAFVYNKIDREYSDQVAQQLSEELAALQIPAEIYPVSALAAYQNAQDGGRRETGQFSRLVRVIEHELDQAQIKEIKRKNLDGLFLSIRDDVLAAVPADFEKRVAGFESQLANVLTEAARAASRQVIANVFAEEDTELANVLRSIQYYSFGGVFGFYLALVDKLRAMRPGYVSVGSLDQFRLRRLLARHCERIELDRIREAMEKAGDAVGRELRGLGVNESLATRLRELLASTGFYDGLKDEVTEALAEAYFAEFERNCLSGKPTRSVWLRSTKFNILPTAFCAFVLGNLIYQYAWMSRPEVVGLDYLTASIVILGVICFVVQIFADKRLARDAWGFLASLQGRVTERVDQTLRTRMGSELGQVESHVRRIAEELAILTQLDLPSGDRELTMSAAAPQPSAGSA